jgi:hypothetical protein
MPGVAFSQPADRKIASFYYSMRGYRVLGIAGATGIKPAVIAQKRTETGFVAGYQENEKLTHQDSCTVLESSLLA